MQINDKKRSIIIGKHYLVLPWDDNKDYSFMKDKSNAMIVYYNNNEVVVKRLPKVIAIFCEYLHDDGIL